MSLLNQLFDGISKTLHRNLDVRMRRHNVIAGNVVNADTPNFIPVDLDFRGTLAAVADGKQGFNVPKAETFYDPTQVPGPDGNAVDIDHEMSRLALNQQAFQASTVALNKRLSMIRLAIMEGRG